MSIDLPNGTKVTFNHVMEAQVFQCMGEWLDESPRSPGLHASDLLDPRLSYWNKENPLPRTRIETDRFFMGKTGEAMIVSMLKGLKDKKGKRIVDPYAGGEQCTSEEFGLEYAPDYQLKGVPLEIKTTRKGRLDESLEDIRYWVEQCLIYMAIMGVTKYYILIFYLCFRGVHGVESRYVIVRLTIPKKELKVLQQQVKDKVFHIKHCFEQKIPQGLPLCREWKCGERMCGQWETCQPEGRYGKLYRDWEEPKAIEMFVP